MHCNEVSVKEITDQMPEEKSETISRDIKLLKNIGVLQAEYSKKEKAYIPLGLEITEPNFSEIKTPRASFEKIRRLCILMQNLFEFDMEEKPLHIELYKELFPDVNVRTRQRDFLDLAKIGYAARHEIEYFLDEDKEKWCYSFEIPQGTYSLPTFNEKKW